MPITTIKCREAFPKLLCDIQCPTTIEIGVLKGQFAEKYIPKLPKDSQIYLLDMWDSGDNLKPKVRKSQRQRRKTVESKFKDRPNVHIVVGSSPIGARLFPDSFFDWIFIDACHSESAVLADMRAWWSKLRENGIFSGHDFRPWKRNGVVEAVHTFFGDIPVQKTAESCPSWWVRKTPDIIKSVCG